MSGTCNLVPSSGTYLCSMQGNMCNITTLRGRSPHGKGVIKLQRICRRLCLARHETSSGYMVDNTKLGSWCKAKEGKKNS